MIVTLRNNRNLLRKRSMLKKRDSAFDAEGVGATASDKLRYKKASEATLRQIRARLRFDRIKATWFAVVMISAIVAMVVLFGYHFRVELGLASPYPNDPIACSDQRATQQFNFFIRDAERWRQMHHSHNTRFQLDKAAELFPEKMQSRVAGHIAAGDVFMCYGELEAARQEYLWANMLVPKRLETVQRVVRCYQWLSLDKPECHEKLKLWKRKLATCDPAGTKTAELDAELQQKVNVFRFDNQLVVK